MTDYPKVFGLLKGTGAPLGQNVPLEIPLLEDGSLPALRITSLGVNAKVRAFALLNNGANPNNPNNNSQAEEIRLPNHEEGTIYLPNLQIRGNPALGHRAYIDITACVEHGWEVSEY
jgi:hypothetical protein